MKIAHFERLSIWRKKWSNLSLSQFGAKRRASRLTFWWKMAILSDFQFGTKSGPTCHWANLEQRDERRGWRFDEKWPFWATFNLAQKVVQLVTEPIWSKETSVAVDVLMKNGHFEWLSIWHKKWSNLSQSQFGAKRWASRLTFWWKMAILSDFQFGTKSGPTCHWANLEQRDERRGWRFDEKWPFWATFNLAQKVVQLVTEPIWSKETSVAVDVLMKNGHFERLSIWHKKWSNLSQSQFGAKRRASRLTFWWKMAILSDFQFGTKSGPTCHWANLEQRDERRGWRFDEKWPFWATFNLAQKVVQLVTEPIWSKETSVAVDVLMKNGHFERLSIWHKKWSNLSLSQFGAKRRALRLTFWWKMAILSDFQFGTKSGPTCHWANLEQRDERRGWRFDEKWPFWATFNLAQKVVQLVTEPIWSKETSVAVDVLMKNGHFERLSIWHKKWSNLSLSQFGAKRRASRLTFWWKMAILSDFQFGTKSGPTCHWANLEQRDERRGWRFDEKWLFWATFNLA